MTVQSRIGNDGDRNDWPDEYKCAGACSARNVADGLKHTGECRDPAASEQKKKRDVMQEGFYLLGCKLTVCQADIGHLLAIAARRDRGLIVHRLPSKGGTLLLLTFSPARPQTTQRIVGLADRFAAMLR